MSTKHDPPPSAWTCPAWLIAREAWFSSARDQAFLSRYPRFISHDGCSSGEQVRAFTTSTACVQPEQPGLTVRRLSAEGEVWGPFHLTLTATR